MRRPATAMEVAATTATDRTTAMEAATAGEGAVTAEAAAMAAAETEHFRGAIRGTALPPAAADAPDRLEGQRILQR